MFAISRIASKLNAVNNLVRKNLSNNNNNDNNDNTNRWSSDLWSDSTPKSITNKLLKLLDSSGLKGKMQIRKTVCVSTGLRLSGGSRAGPCLSRRAQGGPT